MAATGSTVPPPPPRFTGDPKQDLAALIHWVNDFFRAAVLEGFFFSRVNQSDPEDVVVTDLPDPASTNLATAQQTANDAYLLAQQAREDAEAAQDDADRTDNWDTGTVSVADAATGNTVTFSTAQPDTSYIVMIQVKGFTGSPPIGATQVITKTYNTGNFSFTVNQAPGTGNTVNFEWLLVRNL